MITLELVAILVYLGLSEMTLDHDERSELNNRWFDSFGWCFFSLSIVLFLSVYFLLNRLGKKRDQVNSTLAEKDLFNREIRALIAILVIFSTTYMLRGIYDLKMHPDSSLFVDLLIGFGIGILCDFAPVMFL